MRTCCCTVRQRQDPTGAIIATSEWALPAGSSVTIKQPSSSCGQVMCVNDMGLKAVLYVQQCGTAQDACACSGYQLGESLTPLNTTTFQSGLLQMHTWILFLLFVVFSSLFLRLLQDSLLIFIIFILFIFKLWSCIFFKYLSSRIYAWLSFKNKTRKRTCIKRSSCKLITDLYVTFFFTFPRHPREVCYFLMVTGSGRDS